jgi:anti-sigma B factor antagonist
MTSPQEPKPDPRNPPAADRVVTTRRSGRRAIVTLSGELDADVEAEISRTINQTISLRGLEMLHLDTTRVTFIDSSGLRQLVLATQLATALGIDLRIVVDEHGPVARLLDLSGLRQALPIVPDRPTK